MLESAKIIEIVDKVAKANLKPTVVAGVKTQPAIDSQGHDAVRITIVIKPGAAKRLNGDAVIDTLVTIKDRLREAGEERFPIIEYATNEELENGGDPQS